MHGLEICRTVKDLQTSWADEEEGVIWLLCILEGKKWEKLQKLSLLQAREYSRIPGNRDSNIIGKVVRWSGIVVLHKKLKFFARPPSENKNIHHSSAAGVVTPDHKQHHKVLEMAMEVTTGKWIVENRKRHPKNQNHKLNKSQTQVTPLVCTDPSSKTFPIFLSPEGRWFPG